MTTAQQITRARIRQAAVDYGWLPPSVLDAAHTQAMHRPPLTPTQEHAALAIAHTKPRLDIAQDAWRLWGIGAAHARCAACRGHEGTCDRCLTVDPRVEDCPVETLQCDRCRALDTARVARGELYEVRGERAGIDVVTWDGRTGLIPWSALDHGVQATLDLSGGA